MDYGIFNESYSARLCIQAVIPIPDECGRTPVSGSISRAGVPVVITVPDQQHHRMLRICFQS